MSGFSFQGSLFFFWSAWDKRVDKRTFLFEHVLLARQTGSSCLERFKENELFCTVWPIWLGTDVCKNGPGCKRELSLSRTLGSQLLLNLLVTIARRPRELG